MPSTELYSQVIVQAVSEGYTEILCVNMSSGTSGSYQSAVLAEELFVENNPDTLIKIHIVDILSMSHGSGWLLLKTAQLLEEGYTFEQLIELNEKNKRRVKHFLCVDDLHNLTKSGRLSNASEFVGKILNVKPIMTMQNGKGIIVAKERGKVKVIRHYVEELNNRIDRKLSDFIIVGYTSKKETGVYDGVIHLLQMGPVVGTHVGLGGLSLFFMEKENMKLK